MSIVQEKDTIYGGISEVQKRPRGIRLERVIKEDGSDHWVSILSLRNSRHLPMVVEALAQDQAIAFHGWGVSGVGKRADSSADFRAFWFYKEGRPLGSKIPLLEPQEYAVSHVDWSSVHPHFRYLQDPLRLRSLWQCGFPFHLILPYRQNGKTLSEAVVTPAFDPDIAPTTPVPTICLFWMEDPALYTLLGSLKKKNPGFQIGVSSLNDSRETPPFNTVELIDYLKRKKLPHYRFVIEDQLLEPLDISSSHSQFVVPLDGEEPVWKMKRRGSLSGTAFSQATGLVVVDEDKARVAARRAQPEENLDNKLELAIQLIQSWDQGRHDRNYHQLRHLKALLQLV